MKWPGALLRSSRFALLLMLLLAPLATAGTFTPVAKVEEFVVRHFGEGWVAPARFLGLVDTYSSPLFVTLLLLLCLNIVYCTWHRGRQILLGEKKRGGRRKVRLLLDVLLHLSIPLLLCGGLIKATAGFIGTQYLFVDTPVGTAFDWKTESQVPLGITLVMKERVEEYYPLALKVGILKLTDQKRFGPTVFRVGLTTSFDRGALELEITAYNPSAGQVRIAMESSGSRGVEVFDLTPDGKVSAVFNGYEITLLAWRRDLKRIRGRVAFVVDGREVHEGWLVPNGRVAYDGTSVYETSWGKDPYENRYIGIQIVRDPGAPLFWAGAIMLSLALPLFLVVKHRRTG